MHSKMLMKMAEARFQIYRDIADKNRFRLRAPNNKIVAVGEAYETKDGCLKCMHAKQEIHHQDIIRL